MANRKEDEKNERIIRGLLKLPENRRCINCNSLGPQYVCINFWTFVCTNCSGIHREFTHRVKSVSMAKFTSQEVSALQGGGNERAREIYFKEWDPQRHSIPDSSNIMKLRDFIKHVYVDRRYSGDRITDKPPRVKMGDKEESYENRRVDTYRGGSRSPPYEDQRHNERSGPGGRSEDKIYRYNYDDKRSPGHEREIRPGEFRKSPVRFEVVDDRRRDDRFGNGRRFEERRFSDGESKFGGISPNQQKDPDISVPPLVRPVREILGEGVPPLRVGDPPKANGGKAMEVSTHRQRTASSSSLGSVDGSSIELKRANSASLIDFNADPGPPAATTGLPAQLVSTTVQSDTPSTVPSVDDQNWANFDFSPQPVAPAPAQTPAPPKVNTLESLLFELSTPAPTPAPAHGPVPPPPPAPVGSTDLFLTSTAAPITPAGNMPILRTGGGAPTLAINNTSTLPIIGSAAAAPVGNMSPMPVGSSVSAAVPGGMLTLLASGGDSSTKVHDGSQWPSMQQHQSSLFSATDGQSSAPQFVPTDQASNNQNTQGPFGGQPSQAASVSTQEASSGVTSQSTSSEAKNSGRKELPEDLFTLSYATAPAPVRGWHPGPSPGMGFGLQYPTAAAMTNFPHSSKSANPFDLNNEPTLVHAPSLPSMTSLQGALPPVATHQNLLRSTSLNTPSPRWIPQSPSYASSVQSPSYTSNIQSPSYTSNIQSPSYSSAFPPGAYMGQQVPGNMSTSGHQGSGGAFGGDASFYGNLATDHQYGRFSRPATPNSFSSVGGNPFG